MTMHSPTHRPNRKVLVDPPTSVALLEKHPQLRGDDRPAPLLAVAVDEAIRWNA